MLERSSKACLGARSRLVGGFAVLLGVAVLALAPPAAAGDPAPDEATLEAARALGRAGLELYDKGDCDGALAKLEPAYSLYKAPTLGIAAARCLDKRGKLAAAEVRYREVMESDLGPKPSELFVQAKADAAREHEAILPRVPRLTIVVEPADAPGSPSSEVTLDGVALGVEALGAARLVEVGTHEVRARRGAVVRSVGIKVSEGDERRIVLKLDPPASGNPPPAPPPPPPGGKAQRTIGWAAIGVGAAGLIAGGALGGLAISRRSDLDAGPCENSLCPDTIQRDVDEYNMLRRASGAALIAGGVVAAAGVVVLVTAPSGAPPAASAALVGAPRVTLRLGAGSIEVSGSF